MGATGSAVGVGSAVPTGVGEGVALSVGAGVADSGVYVGTGTGVSVAVGVAGGVGLAVAGGVIASAVEVGLGPADGVGETSPSSSVLTPDGGSPSGAVDQSSSSQMELGVRGRASRAPSFGPAGSFDVDVVPPGSGRLRVPCATTSSAPSTVGVAVPRDADVGPEISAARSGVNEGRPDGISGTARTTSGTVPRSPGRIGW